MDIRTVAGRMAVATQGLAAWSWAAFPAHAARVARAVRNQYGVRYTFDDGSVGFIPAGSSEFRHVI